MYILLKQYGHVLVFYINLFIQKDSRSYRKISQKKHGCQTWFLLTESNCLKARATSRRQFTSYH